MAYSVMRWNEQTVALVGLYARSVGGWERDSVNQKLARLGGETAQTMSLERAIAHGVAVGACGPDGALTDLGRGFALTALQDANQEVIW